MDIDIVFLTPPGIDLSMPALTEPCLRSYIEDNSTKKTFTIDLNKCFYNDIIRSIGSYNELSEFKATFKLKDNLKDDVERMLNYQTRLDEIFNLFGEKYKGYAISLNRIKTPYNTIKSEELYFDIKSKGNIFIDFYSDYFNKNRINPKIICISLSADDQVLPCFSLLYFLKEYFPNSVVVFGGNLVTRLYRQIHNSNFSDFYDYLVIREGEEPLLEIVLYELDSNNTISHRNIIRKDSNIVSELLSPLNEPDTAPITDVKRLVTPTFHEVDFDNYFSIERILPIWISRKCHYGKCNFCSIHTSWDPKHRIRDINETIKDIIFYIDKYNAKYFRIVDENIHPNVLDKFSSELIHQNVQIYYEAYASFHKKFENIDFCKKLFESGCRQLFFGIEVIGNKPLKIIHKSMNYSCDIKKIFSNLSQSGIINYGFIMFGYPKISLEDERETINYIISEQNIHVIVLTSFVLDINSPLHLNEKLHNENNIKIYSLGDFSTEIGFKNDNKDSKGNLEQQCENYLLEIFMERPDLALMSLLNTESRLILASRYGNTFAQKYITYNVDKKYIIKEAISKISDERVYKTISSVGSIKEEIL